MEFMRPLALWEKERQNDNTAAVALRVSQSVTHSLSQPAIHHHHPSIVTIFMNNIHNHQSLASQSCIQMAGVRTVAVFEESVHVVIVTVELLAAYIAPPFCTNGSTARAAQNQTNHTNDKPNTAKEHSCVQQQVAASKKKWCSTPLAHQNLPHADARKVSNRIDDAIRTKPRSEEGERRCAMK